MSEPNEHTYGCLRQHLREFTVQQLIHLVNKVNFVQKAIFEVDMKASQKRKGYQATFSEFIKILKDASSNLPKGGPIDVNLCQPAVNQLWHSVKSVLDKATEKMLPF